jgi:hypothetical protein
MGFWGKLAGVGALAGGTALMFVPGGQLAGGALIGAGAGLSKKEFIDEPAQEHKRKVAAELAAETARYSPWTGLRPDLALPEVDTDQLGPSLQGGFTGLQLASSFKNAAAAADAAKAAQAAEAADATRFQMPQFGQGLNAPAGTTMSGTPWRMGGGSWWNTLKPEDLATYTPRSTYGF